MGQNIAADILCCKKKINSNESRFPPDSWILKNTSSTYWPNLDHILSFLNVGIRLWHLSNNIFWISSGFIRELTSCTLNIAHVEWNTEHKLILPAVFIFMRSRWAGSGGTSWSWTLILSLTESRADSLVWSILLIHSLLQSPLISEKYHNLVKIQQDTVSLKRKQHYREYNYTRYATLFFFYNKVYKNI